MKFTTKNGYTFEADPEDESLSRKPGWYGHTKRHRRRNGEYGKTRFYIVRWASKNGKDITEYLHRLIMNADAGKQIDHINGNGLDNTRSNLRFCTTSQNLANQTKHIDNKSGFKGVHWRNCDKRWIAQIKINNRKKYLGSFLTKESAATAYNVAAKQYFGEFARQNQFDEG